MCWQKALSDETITMLIETFARAYLNQVRWFVEVEDDSAFSLNSETGPRRGVVRAAVGPTVDPRRDARPHHRRRRVGPPISRADPASCGWTTRNATRSWPRSRDTSTRSPRLSSFRGIAYDVKDVIAKTGFGIGERRPARLHGADRGLQPGTGQRRRAVDEAGQCGSAQAGGRRHGSARLLQAPRPPNGGRRSARLQAHADPLLGYTDIDGVGFVVGEISP